MPGDTWADLRASVAVGWTAARRTRLVLAVVIVTERSAAAAIALLLFAVGLAVAGVIGIASAGRVSCSCFGRSDRALGWPQVLQLPLWAAAAVGCGTRRMAAQ